MTRSVSDMDETTPLALASADLCSSGGSSDESRDGRLRQESADEGCTEEAVSEGRGGGVGERKGWERRRGKRARLGVEDQRMIFDLICNKEPRGRMDG